MRKEEKYDNLLERTRLHPFIVLIRAAASKRRLIDTYLASVALRRVVMQYRTSWATSGRPLTQCNESLFEVSTRACERLKNKLLGIYILIFIYWIDSQSLDQLQVSIDHVISE
jgi:hypothetical protein